MDKVMIPAAVIAITLPAKNTLLNTSANADKLPAIDHLFKSESAASWPMTQTTKDGIEQIEDPEWYNNYE